MTRLRLLLLLLLLLGPHPAVFEEEEEDPSSEETSEEEEDAITANLTISFCNEALNQHPPSPLEKVCCSTYISVGPGESECFETYEAHQSEGLIAIHNVAICIYVKKKFTKGTENLNFNRIKADLNKLDDPRERKFRMKMYKECSAKAKNDLQAIKAQTRRGHLPLGLRRPFFALVFICTSTYSDKISCPYMLWDKENCGKYRKKCRKLLDAEKL